jgi:PAS domain S-box-containing protein
MDGNWAYLKNRIYLVKDISGKVISLVGTVEDLTGKRLSETALMESETSYRQLFNNSPLPTIIADVNSMRVLDANTVAIEQYGYCRADLLAMTLYDFHPKDQHEKLMTQKEKVKPGVRNDVGTIYYVKKNGERILVEVAVTPIIYKGQDAFLATAKDVTEKVRLEQEMVEQKINYQKGITKAVINAQEKERSEIGKELHDNVSQILATAKLYIENSKHYPEQKDAFLNKSVDLLNGSINEIRRLSHVLVTPTVIDVSFKETLLELIEIYNGLKAFTVNYAFNLDEELIDKSLKLTIYRILQEQFHNTVKHAKASVVQIQIKKIRNVVHFTYEDNGIGFNPRTTQKGIGLKNIANRVNAYQGKVQLKSSIGKGYKMKILFPIG